jgi:hypothetical protein
VTVTDHAALPAASLAALRRDLAKLSSLADVVRWGLAASPPALVADVVVQDEYTHDVILPWGAHHLVFDTT